MDDGAPLTTVDARDELYDRDFYAWGLQQAALLRAGRLGEVDIENVAEEIESLSRSDKREVGSRLTVLVLHLLKWQYQPERRGQSWQATIREQRRAVRGLLKESPSLKSSLADVVDAAYTDGREEATDETGLPESTLPGTCPWSFDQLMDRAFWPD